MKTGNIVSIEANHLMEPGDGALLMRKSKAIKTIQDAFYHDFDLLNWLVDSLPVQVASFGAFDVFNPRKINSTVRLFIYSLLEIPSLPFSLSNFPSSFYV